MINYLKMFWNSYMWTFTLGLQVSDVRIESLQQSKGIMRSIS
jgi:hypothetical protein